MKKITSLVLTVAILMGVMTVTTFANGEYLDPFNNELFTVVKEITVRDNYMPDGVSTYGILSNEDYSRAKITKEEYNENGEFVVTELTDFLPDEELYAKYREFTGGDEYNDGLKEVLSDDQMGYGYYDIDGNEKGWGLMGQGFDCGYNMGLLRDSYGAMNMDTGEHDNVKTTFKKIMSDNKEYKFDADFTDFGDNGCAIMEKDGKFYLVKLNKGVILTVFYNGEKIKFDQVPVIEEGRTLVPLRAIFEKIGADVEWDGTTQSIKATSKENGTIIRLTIDSTTATVNGVQVPLDVPAKIVGGRTLVPVRFISDCFGVNVEWDGVMQKVILTK